MCSFENLFWATAVGFVVGVLPRKQIRLRFKLGARQPKERTEPKLDFFEESKQ